MCVHALLNQDGFYRRGLWVVSVSWHQLASLPRWPPRSLSVHVYLGRSPAFENEEYVVSYLLSGQDPASALSCPVIPISEYRSIGPHGTNSNRLPWGPIYLFPQRGQKTNKQTKIKKWTLAASWRMVSRGERLVKRLLDKPQGEMMVAWIKVTNQRGDEQ